MPTGETAHVTSRDGTRIGWGTSGSGPPLLLVHGGLGDRSRWEALLPYLEPYRSVHAMDRRGRGLSEDHPAYALEREFEDVAAVAEAIASQAEEQVAVYGHSYGGLCAYGAASQTSSIGRLILYEGWPPVHPDAWVLPADLIASLESLLAADERSALVEAFLREAVQMGEEEIAAYRARASWDARVASAHTILREERAFPTVSFDPGEAARIVIPTLLLVGEEQPLDWQVDVVAAALPNARVEVLDGQGHTADVVAPALVAQHLLAFLG